MSVVSSLRRGTLRRGTLRRGTRRRGSLGRGTLRRGTLRRGSLGRGSLRRGSLGRLSDRHWPTFCALRGLGQARLSSWDYYGRARSRLSSPRTPPCEVTL